MCNYSLYYNYLYLNNDIIGSNNQYLIECILYNLLLLIKIKD